MVPSVTRRGVTQPITAAISAIDTTAAGCVHRLRLSFVLALFVRTAVNVACNGPETPEHILGHFTQCFGVGACMVWCARSA